MKTSKLNSRLSDLIETDHLPYYLRHFLNLCAEVFARYPNLFRKSEISRYEVFLNQSWNAFALYVRLYSRKGPWFKVESLNYSEIDTQLAIKELEGYGFLTITLPTLEFIDELYPVITIAELKILLKEKQGLQKKADLWEAFRQKYKKLKEKMDNYVKIEERELFQKLMTIFFGNPFQDLSTFVVEELDHLKHFPVQLSNQKLWKNYKQFSDYRNFIDWENEMNLLLEQGDLESYRSELMAKVKRENIQRKTSIELNSSSFRRTAQYRYLKLLINYATLENRYFKESYPNYLKLLKMQSWPDDLAWHHFNLQIIAAKKAKNREDVSTWLKRLIHQAKPYSYRDEVLVDKTNAWLTGKRRKVHSAPVENIALDYAGNDGLHPLYKMNGQTLRVEEAVTCLLKKNGWIAVHSENFTLRLSGVLLFLDEIFLPIRGQFQSKFQDGPLDFRSKSFYRHRKMAIEGKISHYKKNPGQIRDALLENFKQYNNFALPGLYLKSENDDLVEQMITSIPPGVWLEIAIRYIYHPGLNGTGFPDVTSFKPKSKEYQFIEVKSPGDKLSDSQLYWLNYMKEKHINCTVFQVF